MDEFINHWTTHAPTVLIADTDAGGGVVDAGQFASIRDDLDAAKTLLQNRLNDLESSRVALEQLRQSVGDRVAEFNRRIRADFPTTPAFSRLPLVPNRTAGRDAFLDAMDDMLSIWERVNGLAPSPILPGPLLLGTLTRAQFLTQRAAMDGAFTARGNAERAAAAARIERNGIQEHARALMVTYRAKIEALFAPESIEVQTLPRLTPSAGATPDPVELTGTWNETTQRAELTWTESLDPELSEYQVRAVPGPEYDSQDETVLSTIAPGAPRQFSTAAGLAVPGSAMSYKVYVKLTTGNEAGSDARTVTRP